MMLNKHTDEESRSLWHRAAKVLPLGVNSNFRYWGNESTLYVQKAKGAFLWDVDGNKYIDYRLGFGPIILGHAYDEVDAKVIEEIRKGTLCAMTSELEIAVAEKIVALCPHTEMVRLATSGAEATMNAIRVARAYTQRNLIVKFDGNYHGFYDYTMWKKAAGVDELAPSSLGIPMELRNLIVSLPFNDTESLREFFARRGDQVAAVITEPCMGNYGVIEPDPLFLSAIRELCDEYHSVFILDEVKTGFRLANGGAQEFYGINPDLTAYAKALGNGYPIAAIGGKKAIMSLIGKGVSQGGTYNNNKPGVAAAWATLSILESQPVIAKIADNGQRLMRGMRRIFRENNIRASVSGCGSMFSVAFGVDDITKTSDWDKSDTGFYTKLWHMVLKNGVMFDPDPQEPWFISYSHSRVDIDETLTILETAVHRIKRGGQS